jgi:hypothetical protein
MVEIDKGEQVNNGNAVRTPKPCSTIGLLPFPFILFF